MTPIQSIISTVEVRGDAKPVIFAGFKPRLLGYAASQRDADMLGIISRVRSRYSSTTRCNFPDGRISAEFYMLHE